LSLINFALYNGTPRILHALSVPARCVVATIAAQIIVELVEEFNWLWCGLSAVRAEGAHVRDSAVWEGRALREGVKPGEVEAEKRVCAVAVEANIHGKAKQNQGEEEQRW
jgi:hypothetical protein